jgi:hypothetical protein
MILEQFVMDTVNPKDLGSVRQQEMRRQMNDRYADRAAYYGPLPGFFIHPTDSADSDILDEFWNLLAKYIRVANPNNIYITSAAKVSDVFFSALRYLAERPRLEPPPCLHLAYYKVGNFANVSLPQITGLESLRSLFALYRDDDRFAPTLERIIMRMASGKCPQLRHVTLFPGSTGQPADADARDFEIKEKGPLQTLTLIDHRVDAWKLRAWTKYIDLNVLQSLQFRKGTLWGAAEFITGLAQNGFLGSLRCLSIDWPNLNDYDFRTLEGEERVARFRLEEQIAEEERLVVEMVKAISQARCPLSEVRLSGFTTPFPLTALSQDPHPELLYLSFKNGVTRNVEDFMLRFVEVDGHEMQQLAESCPNLEHLCIPVNRPVEPTEERALYQTLGQFSQLRTLNLTLHTSCGVMNPHIEAFVPSQYGEGRMRNLFMMTAVDQNLMDHITSHLTRTSALEMTVGTCWYQPEGLEEGQDARILDWIGCHWRYIKRGTNTPWEKKMLSKFEVVHALGWLHGFDSEEPFADLDLEEPLEDYWFQHLWTELWPVVFEDISLEDDVAEADAAETDAPATNTLTPGLPVVAAPETSALEITNWCNDWHSFLPGETLGEEESTVTTEPQSDNGNENAEVNEEADGIEQQDGNQEADGNQEVETYTETNNKYSCGNLLVKAISQLFSPWGRS